MALAYQKITLYGESLTDYVWVHNVVDSNTTISNTLANTFVPSWDENTLLLAPFTSDINGGQSNGITGDIVNWWIYKKTEGESLLSLVATIPVSQNAIVDYNILNQTGYQYTIFAETTDYLSTPMQSNLVTTNWWNWSLVGMIPSDTENLYYADSNNIWVFDTNLTSSDLEQTLATYTTDNFTQYPKISQGKRNYTSSSIDCFINNVKGTSGSYSDTVAMQEGFKAFINNGELKLLRDRKGNGWVVQTTGNKFNYVDESAEQITKISFSFIQVDSYSNVRVIGG